MWCPFVQQHSHAPPPVGSVGGWMSADFLDENLKGQLMLLGKIAQRFKGWRPKDVLA